MKRLLLPAMVAIICLVITSCGNGSGLPKGGQTALDNYLKKKEGAHFEYSIVSAERATAIEDQLKATEWEVDEFWCVVTDQGVTFTDGACSMTTNIFVTYQQGGMWKSDLVLGELVNWSLLEDPSQLETIVGCTNVLNGSLEWSGDCE
jgi:hypothetical protein